MRLHQSPVICLRQSFFFSIIRSSNLRVLNTIDIQRMPTGSQPKHNSSSKKDDDDDEEKQTILQQPRRVSSFTAAAMEDRSQKKERSTSVLDGWWSLC